MRISVEDGQGLERQITVELPIEGLEQKINERLAQIKDQVNIEGFRPGKAPLDVVRSKFGPGVQEEVFSETIGETLNQALEQQGLKPVDDPAVEIDADAGDTVFRYFATFEVMPQVDIQPVEQIKLERPVVEVTEADVDKLIDNLRSQRMLWRPADRPANTGDRVTIDYSGTIDGQAFGGGMARGLQVVIGEGSLLPGFEEQLVELKGSDTSNVKVTIPETFPDSGCRGKIAEFEVKVHAVEAAQLPNLDDAFFRSFGVTEGGLARFREQIRISMERQLEQKRVGMLKLALIDQLLELHDLSVPKTMIQLEIERIKQLAGDDQSDMKTEEEIAAQAEHRVSGGIVLTELANSIGVSPTPELIRQKIEFLAQEYENPDEVVAWYYSSTEQMASAEAMVSEELLIEYVLEHGNVKDKLMSFAELMES